MTSIYDLINKLRENKEQRAAMEQMEYAIPPHARPLLSDIFTLMKLVEQTSELIIDDLSDLNIVNADEHVFDRSVFAQLLNAKVDQLARELGVDE